MAEKALGTGGVQVVRIALPKAEWTQWQKVATGHWGKTVLTPVAEAGAG